MPRDVVSDEADDYLDDENQAEGLSPPGPGSYERDHVCIYCNRRCSRPSLLRVHMRIHTGVTPFQCPHPNCGRVFNVKSNMKRHYARHIPKNSSANSNINPSSQVRVSK
ncbi:hypothetical protein BDZ89DRAFT_950593 [Hymenopellis radicata]|nr:hypothetical protein BDZ89DRAFT_950593 [Hymenopellis radicata]